MSYLKSFLNIKTVKDKKSLLSQKMNSKTCCKCGKEINGEYVQDNLIETPIYHLECWDRNCFICHKPILTGEKIQLQKIPDSFIFGKTKKSVYRAKEVHSRCFEEYNSNDCNVL